jgi:hypothetical protein
VKIRLLISIALLFGMIRFGYSQRIVKGYYVALNNDSVPAKFLIPRFTGSELTKPGTSLFSLFGKHIDFSALKDQVKIIDSNGVKSQLLPTEIKGFVFSLDSTTYKMFAKPITEERWGFLQAIVMGRKLRLFHYIEIEPGSPTVSTPGFGPGFSPGTPDRKWDHWTLERYDHVYLFLDGKMSKNQIFAKLKAYFKNNQQMLDLIDQKIGEEDKKGENKGDIVKAIVDAYNAS